MTQQVAVYHNIVWPKYKGAVFSALNELSLAQGPGIGFVQIAETDGERAALSGVDMRYHRYPFELVFKGAYDAVPTRRLVWALARHVARSPARLVVLPGYHRLEYWSMLLACMLTRKRRAVFCDSTTQDRPRGFVKGLLKRLFFINCDGFFGYGQRSAEYLRANGVAAARIYQPCQAAALPLGFDAAQALARRVAARALAPEARVLYVGRLSAEKDLPSLLKAFQQFRAERAAARLVLVGAGPQRDMLVAQAAALGLASSVEFTGAMDIEGLADQYARALCLVLPSTSEPWGLVVNEALHHGCPVLVSESCGCRPELVADGVTGFAYAAGNVQALHGGLVRITDTMGTTAAVAAVAAACQQHMTAYTPRHAAEHILAGCISMLGTAR